MAAVFVILAMMSMITCLVVASTIYFNKPLRKAHPSLLIGLMCLSDSITCYSALVWQLNTVKFCCYFGIDKLYLNSVKMF